MRSATLAVGVLFLQAVLLVLSYGTIDIIMKQIFESSSGERPALFFFSALAKISICNK